jgi:hypothetical protein
MSELFDAPVRICAIGGSPAGGSIEGFAEELRRHGYPKISICSHIRSAKRIVRWAVRRGLSTSSIKLEVLDAVTAPSLRSGRFRASDKLIASLTSRSSFMR